MPDPSQPARRSPLRFLGRPVRPKVARAGSAAAARPDATTGQSASTPPAGTGLATAALAGALVAGCGGTGGTLASPAPPPPALAPSPATLTLPTGYRLVWSDEFDAPGLPAASPGATNSSPVPRTATVGRRHTATSARSAPAAATSWR